MASSDSKIIIETHEEPEEAIQRIETIAAAFENHKGRY
jgi:hypothetical protein